VLGSVGALGAAAYNYFRPTSKQLASAKASLRKTSGARRLKGSKKLFPKKVKGQIKALKQLADADMGEITYRLRNTRSLIASVNEAAYVAFWYLATFRMLKFLLICNINICV
jgi:hypothetical protein